MNRKLTDQELESLLFRRDKLVNLLTKGTNRITGRYLCFADQVEENGVFSRARFLEFVKDLSEKLEFFLHYKLSFEPDFEEDGYIDYYNMIENEKKYFYSLLYCSAWKLYVSMKLAMTDIDSKPVRGTYAELIETGGMVHHYKSLEDMIRTYYLPWRDWNSNIEYSQESQYGFAKFFQSMCSREALQGASWMPEKISLKEDPEGAYAQFLALDKEVVENALEELLASPVVDVLEDGTENKESARRTLRDSLKEDLEYMEQVAEQSYADFSEEDLFSNLDKATRQEILDSARCYEEKNAWQEEVLKTLADGEMWTDFRSHLGVVMKLQGFSYLCNPYTLKRMSVKEACMGMVDLFIAEHYETQIMDPDRFYGVLCDGLEKAFGLRRI